MCEWFLTLLWFYIKKETNYNVESLKMVCVSEYVFLSRIISTEFFENNGKILPIFWNYI